jgi:hypothetical protein
MSFSELLKFVDKGRKDRSKDVKVKPMRVVSMENNEAWTFGYKSNPSTTGDSHKGYIRFLKENISQTDDPEKIDCLVNCGCPDYKYRWSYSNGKKGVGVTGAEDLSKSNGSPPTFMNPSQRVGLCKHLVALGSYLDVSINSSPATMDSPKQKSPTTSTNNNPSNVKSVPNIFENLSKFVKNNKFFNVNVDE